MTTLSIGVLLAAGAICETSRAPGGPRIAAKLYEAARNGHRLDEDYHCPTIRALDEENAQSRAPQHPNPYRQTEGNRA